MTTPTPRRECDCGFMPTVQYGQDREFKYVQVKCQCGQHGGITFYKKPEQREWAEQAAVDGWDLG